MESFTKNRVSKVDNLCKITSFVVETFDNRTIGDHCIPTLGMPHAINVRLPSNTVKDKEFVGLVLPVQSNLTCEQRRGEDHTRKEKEEHGVHVVYFTNTTLEKGNTFVLLLV